MGSTTPLEASALATVDVADFQTPTLRPPSCFLCPLIKTIMMEPVVSLETGISFEYSAIRSCSAVRGSICPVTGGALGELVFNHELQTKIVSWRQQQQRAKLFRQQMRRRKLMAEPHSARNSQGKWSKQQGESSGAVPHEMFEHVEDLVRFHTRRNLQNHALEHEGMLYHPESKLPPRSTPCDAPARPSAKSVSIFRNGPILNVPCAGAKSNSLKVERACKPSSYAEP